MRKNVYIFFALYFFVSLNSFCQWVDRSNWLPGWGVAMVIDACDENTAVISANFDSSPSFIFLTTDKGTNWNGLSFAIVDKAYHDAIDVEIIDKDHIWAAMGDGRIIATTNGGSSWQTQFYDTNKTKFMNYIEMFDAKNGIAMGDCNILDNQTDNNSPALILKTTNGGEEWIQTNTTQLMGLSSGDMWRRIDFINDNVGFFFSSGESPQKYYSTTDSGISWDEVSTGGYAQVLRFYDDKLGLIYNGNDIYKTNDGGKSWNKFPIDANGWGNDIEFLPGDPAKVWFTDNQKLYFSADSGKTWHVSDSTIGGRDIVFTDANNGWVLGDGRQIYSTANGSNPIVGISETNLSLPKDLILEQNYPNPFNPETVIDYSLPAAGHVSLKIYDILGNEITTLIDEFKQAGKYQVNFSTKNHHFSSGLYVYKLTSRNFSVAKKMLFLK